MEQKETKKRPYTAPRLVVYGNVRTLTREGGIHTAKDGGNNARTNRT